MTTEVKLIANEFLSYDDVKRDREALGMMWRRVGLHYTHGPAFNKRFRPTMDAMDSLIAWAEYKEGPVVHRSDWTPELNKAWDDFEKAEAGEPSRIAQAEFDRVWEEWRAQCHWEKMLREEEAQRALAAWECQVQARLWGL